MNRVLDYSLCKRDTLGYKVQSEMELWWIGFAQVPLESHETLKQLSTHTNIPSSFIVEWHLSADLKALKAMFGICGGENTKYPCIYCMSCMGKDSQTLEIDIGRQPCGSMVDLTKFPRSKKIGSPILPFHLQNGHICTLQAEIRILDKILCLHLDYAY